MKSEYTLKQDGFRAVWFEETENWDFNDYRKPVELT